MKQAQTPNTMKKNILNLLNDLKGQLQSECKLAQLTNKGQGSGQIVDRLYTGILRILREISEYPSSLTIECVLLAAAEESKNIQPFPDSEINQLSTVFKTQDLTKRIHTLETTLKGKDSEIKDLTTEKNNLESQLKVQKHQPEQMVGSILFYVLL